jgi:hypothetical protein
MGLPITTIWEVQTGGSDSANAGGFDPANASMAADGAATVANTSAPVFTSASYNFTASDVNAWLFIQSGTNWTPGWYKIASVASNAATLSAAIGAAVLYDSTNKTVLQNSASTVVGCATVASPTSARWSVDYSQQAAVRTTLTAATAAGAGSTITDASIGKNWVGNNIRMTGGTNVTTGVFNVLSTSTTTATLDRAVTTGATSNAAGGMGGAVASLNGATSIAVGSNLIYMHSGSYSLTANPSFNPGSVTPTFGGNNPTRIVGYNALRGDLLNSTTGRPVLTASGSCSAPISVSATGWHFENLVIDCGSVAASTGITVSNSYCTVRNCWIKNFTVYGINFSGGSYHVVSSCEVSGGVAGATAGINDAGVGTRVRRCYVHGNACTGISIGGSAQAADFNLVCNNTGASSDGILTQYSNQVTNNTSYGNGRDGIRCFQYDIGIIFQNNILVNNGGYGINATFGGFPPVPECDNNAFYNNTSGTRFACGTGATDVILTGDPFTNAAGGDFSLNNTAGAGAACRAAGIPGTFPGGLTTGKLDMGAVQHVDPVSGGIIVNSAMNGGMT